MTQTTQREKALIVRDSKASIASAVIRFCMHDGICGRKAICRGLCRSHSQALYRLVRESEGKITFEQLERSGRCLPLRRSAKAWFLEGIANC